MTTAARATARLMLVAVGMGACVHPLVDRGHIDHHFVVQAPHIDDPEFGKSSGTPVVLRIPVGPQGTGDLGYVGRLAHAELFSDLPAFDFNVAFASAHVSLSGDSAYADPRSIWYNAFFGFYEIDAPMAKWSRPFGYDGPGPDAKVVAREVERIGRADWNYFSNHLYGVPLAAIRACCAAPPPGVVRVLPRVSLVSLDGPKDWDDLDVRDVTVVGPHRSTADGGAFEHPHSERDAAPPGMERLWQRTFGTHPPTATPPTSFAPVRLRARIRMFHDVSRVQGKPVYRTFLFGATVDADAEPAKADRFLRLQLAALEKVMKTTHLGFEEP
jgi:hypothetical protein